MVSSVTEFRSGPVKLVSALLSELSLQGYEESSCGTGCCWLESAPSWGLAAAVGVTRLMSSLLFGITTLDPAAYAAVSVILLASAALASYLPARRASTVDPTEILRAE